MGIPDVRHRPVWAEVDLGAIRANVRALIEAVAPARVLAVVKADAYGHGSVPVARAAVAAGATGLGVALVEEGQTLRRAGIAAPILLLSEPPADAAEAVVGLDLTPVVYTPATIDALAAAATVDRPLGVHLKIDTGMHRVGCAPDAAAALVDRIAAHETLRWVGVCTHLAVADEPDRPETLAQLAVFAAARADLAAHGHDSDAADVEVHAANSAGALAFVAAHFDFVRPGIALYGIAPSAAVPALMLEPALALKAQVSYVQDLRAGDAISYGLRYRLDRSGRVATVPVGYADGVPRALGEHGGQALVHGVRVPIAGTITMDQLMLDVGDVPVVAGDEVVLLGRQGDAAIDAAEWAQRIGTIPYEIVTGIGPRVPRHYVNGDGDEGADAMTATGEVERGHGA